MSITRKAFLICLTIAGGGFLWLAGLIGRWGVERVPSIGGGSYSLDRFVYSGLILLWTGGWALGALILGLVREDAAKAKRAFLLAGIGSAAFVASCRFYGHNLS